MNEIVHTAQAALEQDATRRQVLVLGGRGAVGSRVVTLLGDAGHEVTVASRRRGAAVGAATTLQLDATDPVAMERAARSVDVVVNCSGLEDPALARTTFRTGADFVDISATPRYLAALESLENGRSPLPWI